MMRHVLSAALLLTLAGVSYGQAPLTTAFNYQGELRNGGSPASGLHDFRFRLYDAAAAGTQFGSTLCIDNISVSAGRFTVDLDFGSHFAGEQRFLEIEVRADTGLNCSNGAGFTLLTPRQSVSAAPHSLFALNATQFNGQAATFYQDASNLSAGTIPSARLSGTYSGALTLNSAANALSGSGAGLTSLNATNLASGTLADARLSANIPRLNTVNTFGNITNSFLGNVGIGTSTPGMKLTVAGDMELGTTSSDYRRFRIGGGNSSGFIYGSFAALADGIHMGYNYYANAAGVHQIIAPGGGTSRISTGYGAITLATGNVGQVPVNRLVVDQVGTTYFLRSDGSGVGAFFADPDPSPTWPAGTFPGGTAYNSAGAMTLYGAAGHQRFGVRSRYNVGTSVFPNQAEMYMDDASATKRISIYVSGESGASGNIVTTNLFASGSKSFVVPNPDNPREDITYYCLEGPESGMYTRGTGRLVNGRAHINLPTTFSSLASKEGLTVILTPLSETSLGLACTARSIYGFDVVELSKGAGNYEFDWEIKAVRRGRRDDPVIRPWTEFADHSKPADVQWKQRLAELERQADAFAKEDEQLGARP